MNTLFWSHAITAPLFMSVLPVLPVLLLWSLFWKGLALWHAGRKAQPWWFVILLVVNTAGILEIIYLFAVLRLHLTDLFTTKAENEQTK